MIISKVISMKIYTVKCDICKQYLFGRDGQFTSKRAAVDNALLAGAIVLKNGKVTCVDCHLSPREAVRRMK